VKNAVGDSGGIPVFRFNPAKSWRNDVSAGILASLQSLFQPFLRALYSGEFRITIPAKIRQTPRRSENVVTVVVTVVTV
jgi:hypothetical protein